MAKGISKKVGVKDIAKVAGVSIGTVDRVLHNRGEVKNETREKIMAIVNELGYQPNVLAKSLASKKTTQIAIVIPDSSDNNPYWKKPVLGIEKAANELANFNIEIIFEYFDASSETSFKNVLQKVSDENPDGIVLNPIFSSIALHFISIFNSRNIPYVFIDVDLKGVGKLGYFGQDAEQSGVVSGKLMSISTVKNPKILIVKQSKKKVFSQHIESRVIGFSKYFKEQVDSKNYSIVTIEIDLDDEQEPEFSLNNAFKIHKTFDGVFVPNSRVFKVADFIEKMELKNMVTIGFDLVNQNLCHLEKGNISFLISQKPEDQAYNAIMALFDNLIMNRKVQKTTYSPIDIIIKENIEYYKERK